MILLCVSCCHASLLFLWLPPTSRGQKNPKCQSGRLSFQQLFSMTTQCCHSTQKKIIYCFSVARNSLLKKKSKVQVPSISQPLERPRLHGSCAVGWLSCCCESGRGWPPPLPLVCKKWVFARLYHWNVPASAPAASSKTQEKVAGFFTSCFWLLESSKGSDITLIKENVILSSGIQTSILILGLLDHIMT